jgi:pimeloyl-ACP methyl ester carboxylesterase
MTILYALTLLVVTLLLAGILYQQIGVAIDRRRVRPPGQIVRVPGGSFHVNCVGQGDIIVILESGISASSLSWGRVQSEVAKFARVCSYDRPGFGWSDRRRGGRTPGRLAQELNLMLYTAEFKPPYLLVGHSFGGLIVRAYAAQFPNEVCGIVLVDALHPAEWAEPTREQKRALVGGIFLSWIGGLLCSLGIVRLCISLAARGRTRTGQTVLRGFGTQVAAVVKRVLGEVTKLPAELLPVVRAHWTQPKSFLTQARYFASLAQSSREVLNSQLPPELPLIVLSADNPIPARAEEQRQLATLCKGAEHTVIAQCGHWIHLDRPELVVKAVRRMLERSRPAPAEQRRVRTTG